MRVFFFCTYSPLPDKPLSCMLVPVYHRTYVKCTRWSSGSVPVMRTCVVARCYGSVVPPPNCSIHQGAQGFTFFYINPSCEEAALSIHKGPLPQLEDSQDGCQHKRTDCLPYVLIPSDRVLHMFLQLLHSRDC